MATIRISNILLLASILCAYFAVTWTLPVLDAASSGIDNETIEELRASVNDTPKNLYVVRAVVYEIGILTEVDDNDTSFESQERVDLTFYDAHTNDSHINLGNIPLPIQTNVTGQVLTGIAPVNVGAFSSPGELLSSLPLTGTIVNITQSNTALFQLTKSNVSDAERPHVLDGNNLPDVARLLSQSSGVSVSSAAAPASSSSTSSSSSVSSAATSDSSISNSVEGGD